MHPTHRLRIARSLHLVARFFSLAVKPISTWDLCLASLKSSLDRFDASLLTAFDAADTRGDEVWMKEVACAGWEVEICTNGINQRVTKFDGPHRVGDGQLWVEKREVFYEQGKWDSSANFTCAHPCSTRSVLTGI
ncbi:hypothetical protein JVU11DRAFT_12589 [Chiua virens]|nr:hypothetical protein JVU11DRAFT_12589 [Chiua virens]